MIEIKNVSKNYGSIEAVKDISLKIPAGEIFAMLGPNGAGKSTTIKMLTTLLKPSSGSMTLNGHDVVKDQEAARKSFGIVFQDPSVDSEMTAYENMRLHGVLYGIPMSELKERIKELLVLLELWERRSSLVKTFSGGMKRRLEIARGLLHHPKILFLDEPTVGLDAQTRHLLWNYVQRLSKEKNMTIFFTTHYIDEAEENASHIAFVDHGSIIAQGSPAELMKKTKTNSLEKAYLAMTGSEIRDTAEDPHNVWRERQRAKAMR